MLQLESRREFLSTLDEELGDGRGLDDALQKTMDDIKKRNRMKEEIGRYKDLFYRFGFIRSKYDDREYVKAALKHINMLDALTMKVVLDKDVCPFLKEHVNRDNIDGDKLRKRVIDLIDKQGYPVVSTDDPIVAKVCEMFEGTVMYRHPMPYEVIINERSWRKFEIVDVGFERTDPHMKSKIDEWLNAEILVL